MSKLRVYIATQLDKARWVDCVVATMIEARGCEVVSTWHRPPFERDESTLTDDEALRLRTINLRDLSRADVCLVLSTERGGEHHGDAAVAHGAGLPLVWEGRLILLARQPDVIRVATMEAAVEAVARLAERRNRSSWMPPQEGAPA